MLWQLFWGQNRLICLVMLLLDVTVEEGLQRGKMVRGVLGKCNSGSRVHEILASLYATSYTAGLADTIGCVS